MIQKRREPTISACTMFSYSKSFVHQSPIHRNGAQPQQNNFKCYSLPAMKPPCTTNFHLCWQSKPAKSWPRLIFSVICHKEKYIITLVLLWYPCRSWLHIFEEKNFGVEPSFPWELQFTCPVQKGPSLKLVCFPLHWYWGEQCAVQRESLWAGQHLPAQYLLSNTGACCNLPTELCASPVS